MSVSDAAPAYAAGGRHRRRNGLGLPALATAALVAFGGTGAAFTLVGSPSAAASDTADASLAAAALADRGQESDRASRAAGRSAVPAAASVATGVTAPAAASPVKAATYGAVGVKAVAKPKPKPVVVPAVATTPTTGGSTSTAAASTSSSSTSTGGGSTTAYASAGAALGLSSSAIAVYSAIRSTFGITNIGGYRAGDPGDHGSGRAVDVMTSGAQGDAVAAYAIANMGRFGISYVIWKQRIWMAGSSGWRFMEDRGSATQNHYDHVHISVN